MGNKSGEGATERGFLGDPQPFDLDDELLTKFQFHVGQLPLVVHASGQVEVLLAAEAMPPAAGLAPPSLEGTPYSPSSWTKGYCLLLPPKRRTDSEGLERSLASEGPEA